MPKKIMGSTFTIHKILFLFSFLPNVNGQSAGTIPSSITGCGNAGATKTAIKTTELTAMGCISVSGCSAAAAVVSGGAGSSRCAASAYPSSSLPTTGSIGEDEPGSKSKFTQEIALPEEVALSIGDTGGCADSAKEIDRSNAVDLICNNLFLMFVKSSFMSSLLSIPIVLILLLRCFILLHLTTYLTKYCARLFTCSKAKVNLNLALTKMVSTKKSSNILNMGWSFKFVLVLCFMDVADAYEKLPNGNGKDRTCKPSSVICAVEYGTCSCPGGKVRYGSRSVKNDVSTKQPTRSSSRTAYASVGSHSSKAVDGKFYIF